MPIKLDTTTTSISKWISIGISKWIRTSRGYIEDIYYSGGVGAVVKISASKSWGPRFNPQSGRGLNIWGTFFAAKVNSAFHPFGASKMSTSIH